MIQPCRIDFGIESSRFAMHDSDASPVEEHCLRTRQPTKSPVRELNNFVVEQGPIELVVFVVAVVASFVAESTRDPELAALNSKFSKARRQASKRVIDDAVNRGDLPSETDSRQMADDLAAGIFFKGLIVRESIDDKWLEAHIDRWISIYSTN